MVLNLRIPCAHPTFNIGDLKRPNVDDIYDFTDQMRDVVHELSCFLLTRPKSSESFEQRELLKRFRLLCGETVQLLEGFSEVSQSISHLAASHGHRTNPLSLQSYANATLSVITAFIPRIDKVEAQYLAFVSTFKQFLFLVSRSNRLQKVGKDLQVFTRIDAFWRVVATQLATMLQETPGPKISLIDINGWNEYQGGLICAIFNLKRFSEALDVCVHETTPHRDHKSRHLLVGYVRRGFNSFWTKLMGREWDEEGYSDTH